MKKGRNEMVIKEIFDITRRTQIKYFCRHSYKTAKTSTSQFSIESVIRQSGNCNWNFFSQFNVNHIT